MTSENSKLRLQRLHSTVRLVSHGKVLLRGDESYSQCLMRLQLDQKVDGRKLDVSDTSKETCNLCQPTFVGVYFVSKPPV